MAEIKSTLDLVMEKTRNLTMSEDDRREQCAAEFRDGVNRLIQKYLQAELDVSRFQRELARLGRDFPQIGLKAVEAEVAKRIDPARDNRLLLKLLHDGFDKDVAGIEGLLKIFSDADVRIAAEISARIVEDLKKSGISGTAVVPNITADERLVVKRERLLDAFRKDLEAEIDRLG